MSELVQSLQLQLHISLRRVDQFNLYRSLQISNSTEAIWPPESPGTFEGALRLETLPLTLFIDLFIRFF